MIKVNPKIKDSQSPITSTIPKEVKKNDIKTKPNVEEKVKEVINKEKINLNEADGIMIELIDKNQSYLQWRFLTGC